MEERLWERENEKQRDEYDIVREKVEKRKFVGERIDVGK
jgi:hypothetical protein